ncbi:hypothetical protein BGX23_008311 [Mortierella sp. AD031]|nr:hypothetical protein BGX23_008311 [Mortierella sp. AD031]
MLHSQEQQERVQTVRLASKNRTVDITTHPDASTGKEIVLWEDVLMVFPNALYLQHGTRALPFLKGRVQYAHGQGVPQDYAKAMEWFLKASNQGHASAHFGIGFLYNYGHGVVQDYSNATEWYLKAAEQGYAAAQVNIGKLYENGQGVTQDYSAAMEWYLKAAKRGYPLAQSNVGAFYERGLGVLLDYKVALEWYLKAASQGDASAQNNIGMMHEDGHGVPRDCSKAMEWYGKAATVIHEIIPTAEFNKLIAFGDKVIVDYYAIWSLPPKFEYLAEQTKDIAFVKVDVDTVPDASAAAGITAMPTFQSYHKSARVGEVIGADLVNIKQLVAVLLGAV